MKKLLSYPEIGIHYKQEHGSLVAFKTHNSKKYTITEIRKNKE